MKMEKLFLLSLILGISYITSLPMVTKAELFLSNDELQEFKQKIEEMPPLEKRTNEQIERRKKFQKAWAKVNPSIAPFLGNWYDYSGEFSISIFPTKINGRVCIIEHNAGGVSLGTLFIGDVFSGGMRYNPHRYDNSSETSEFFLIDQLEDVLAHKSSGNNKLFPMYTDANLFYLRHPPSPSGVFDEISLEIREKFKSEGCTSSIPEPLQSGELVYEDVKDPNYPKEKDKGVTEKFRVGIGTYEEKDGKIQLNSNIIAGVSTIIVIHGWNNDPQSPGFSNVLQILKKKSAQQVIAVDWGQGAKTENNLALATSRIKAVAETVTDLILRYNLNPEQIDLVGHSLGSYVSTEIALELKKRNQPAVKSITLLDPALDIPGFYEPIDLLKLDQSTFVRAFYTSAAGDQKYANSANESYNLKYPTIGRFDPLHKSPNFRLPDHSHGEAMTLFANFFQGDSSGNINCIAKQFTQLSIAFPGVDLNEKGKNSEFSGMLDVEYDQNGWIYPATIHQDNIKPDLRISPNDDCQPNIKSVAKVKNAILDKINILTNANVCAGACLLTRQLNICSLVEKLDIKVGGKILGTKRRSSLEISQSDLQLMRLIYHQCEPISQDELPSYIEIKLESQYKRFSSSESTLIKIKKGLEAN